MSEKGWVAKLSSKSEVENEVRVKKSWKGTYGMEMEIFMKIRMAKLGETKGEHGDI